MKPRGACQEQKLQESPRAERQAAAPDEFNVVPFKTRQRDSCSRRKRRCGDFEPRHDHWMDSHDPARASMSRTCVCPVAPASRSLLVPQCFYRVEARSALRGIKAEDDADEAAE